MKEVLKVEEDQLRSLPKIEFAKDVEINSISDVIENAVSKGKETFYEDGSIQCTEWRNRSLSDLYRLVVTYFPTASLSDILKTISSFDNIFGMRCCDIGKYVFYKDHIDSEELEAEGITELEYKWRDSLTEFGIDMLEIADYLDIE